MTLPVNHVLVPLTARELAGYYKRHGLPQPEQERLYPTTGAITCRSCGKRRAARYHVRMGLLHHLDLCGWCFIGTGRAAARIKPSASRLKRRQKMVRALAAERQRQWRYRNPDVAAARRRDRRGRRRTA